MCNVHLDYPSQDACKHSISILLSQIQANDDHIDKIIVTENFNNWPGRVEDQILIDKLIVLGQQAPKI